MRPLLIVLVALLGVSSLALARKDVSDAKALITGAGGRYTLAVTNTGIKSIRCMTFRPSYPVELVLREPSDPNVLTAQPNLDPGHTWRVVFRTKRPYPRGAGGMLTLNNPSYTDTCVMPGRKVRVVGPPKR